MSNLGSSAIGQTYNALESTVVQGDSQVLQQAVDNSSGWGMFVLMSGIITLVSISSVIETGTFFGILLPSDIILSASAIVLISSGKRIMVIVIALLSIIFTVVGDTLGYSTGKKLGEKLYEKEDTWYFKKEYLLKAQDSLLKNGEKILFTGRYLSIGGFLPTICGVMRMDFNRFLQISVLSASMREVTFMLPIIIIMLIFPSIQIAILVGLMFTIPEIIGWIVLLKPTKEGIEEEIALAKQQIQTIRQSITEGIGEISQTVNTIADTGKQYANQGIKSVKATITSAQDMAQSIQGDVSSMMQQASPSLANNITSNNGITIEPISKNFVIESTIPTQDDKIE